MPQDQDDNVDILNGSTTANVATDWVQGDGSGDLAHHQIVKLAWGPDGTANYVDNTTGKHIPVQLYSAGTAIGTEGSGSGLNVFLDDAGASLDVIITGMGIDAVQVEGTTFADVPVMISGTTAIGGAIDIKGTGETADFIYIAGFSGATAIAVTGDVAVSGTVGITTDLSLPVTGDVAVSGTVAATGTIGITTATGVCLPVQGDVAVTGDVAVSGAVTVSGLTMGPVGTSAEIASGTDSIVVQGITNSYPVFTHLGYITADGNAEYIGVSGDALKVDVVGAAISATITDTNITVGGGTIEIEGGTLDDVTITGGTLDGISGTVGISGNVNITNPDGVTVAATDLDIRGLTFGPVGKTGAPAASTDSVVVQGVSGAFPVASVLHGISNDANGNPVALGLSFDGNVPILRTAVDSMGIENSTAFQIQGRSDGITLNPVFIAGVGATSAAGGVSPTEGLVGVTFDIKDGLPVMGGLTAPTGSSFGSIATAIHGASGSKIAPVGMSGDALNVNVAGAAINATISDTNLTIAGGTIDHILGGTLDDVTITGGTLDGISGTVGVSFEHQDELAGLSANLTNIYAGLTGVCAAFDALEEAVTTANNTNTSVVSTVESLVTTLDTELTTIDTNVANITDGTSTVKVQTDPPATMQVYTIDADGNSQQFFSGDTPDDVQSGFRVKSHPEASDIMFVGRSIDDLNSGIGFPLAAGDELFIEIDNIEKIFMSGPDGTNNTLFALGY